MSDWGLKRFWSEAHVTGGADGYGIALDSRPVRTPGKVPLKLPTRPLAAAVAAEWQAQQGAVDPGTMPLTRAANAALDKVTPQRAEVAAMLASYGDTDLICYRAESPAELVARQAAAWDPLLDWAASTLGARLVPVAGLIPRPQDPQALARLSAQVGALDIWDLTAFHDLVSLSGSLVIGFAALRHLRPAADLWQVSRIDETWQAELWGADEEAATTAARKESDFLQAQRFCDLARCGA